MPCDGEAADGELFGIHWRTQLDWMIGTIIKGKNHSDSNFFLSLYKTPFIRLHTFVSLAFHKKTKGKRNGIAKLSFYLFIYLNVKRNNLLRRNDGFQPKVGSS